MSFSSPLWLLALALIPVSLAVQALGRRRARRYAIRFPAAEALRLAAGSTPSWRRVIPLALLLAAFGALSVALARPHVPYRAPVNEASVMLVTDHSGSMAANDVQPTRLSAAQRAADSFISQLPTDVQVGAVAFSSTPDAVQAPTSSHAAARAIIDGQSANGSTATGTALSLALQLLHASNPHHAPAAIVLLSDGAANAGESPGTVAQQARRDHIPIDTVALGTPGGTLPNPDPFGPPVPVPPDPQLMTQIARASGGRSFDAQTADQLSSIYKNLGKQLGSVQRKHEVTAEFAAAGVLLLVLAGAASARWAGRLP